MRTSEISALPVVTLAGDDIAQVKDIAFSGNGGAVSGFTLAGRGRFAGPLKTGLLWTKVVGLGADAVIVADESALDPVDDVRRAAESADGSGASGGNVLGDQVLTDGGTDLGKVVDVIVQFDNGSSACDVVGYEIEASESLAAKASNASNGTRLLVPLPDTLAVSGEHLMVPASAEGFVSGDLAGFGAAVSAFRAQLDGKP
ncbi:PRC-barrel domain-containing protein [Nocardioides sp.]|uniref:PRC-barrel domain-containing protein n=1 Tax=Nocardioides sp. TaxID=35761 RepID=UPI002716F1A9|nr:PRC-barrel domain-containing protein [Nocardioides sp.]MDO9456349.1 PRC-barrel domain-containing protein [Nocardioides sp.]